MTEFDIGVNSNQDYLLEGKVLKNILEKIVALSYQNDLRKLYSKHLWVV